MKKQKLHNRSLDIVGRRLLKIGSGRMEEIEKMMSDPNLYGFVAARIARNGNSKAETPISGSLSRFLHQNVIAMTTVSAILLAVTIGLATLLRHVTSEVVEKKIQVPDSIPDVARPAAPLQEVVSKISPGRAFYHPTGFEWQDVSRVERRPVRRPGPRVKSSTGGDFYYLSTSGDQDESPAGGKIIRVNLSRSSLFALGVNVPLENGPDDLKAELLVGSDGRTRAIRVVD